MTIAADWVNSHYSPAQARLLRRTLSPFIGLDQMVGTVVRGAREPRMHVMGADLTGVHVIRGQPRPKAGAYHIGGSGALLGEALIRTCGETAERYAQLMSEFAMTGAIERASFNEMRARGLDVLPASCFTYLTEDQLEAQRLGLRGWDDDAVLGWVSARAVPGGTETWLPAQAVLVGYVPKGQAGEPWLFPCMTTGTAVHTSYAAAFQSALLELVQIDSAIGFWYTGRAARPIALDRAAGGLPALLERALLGTGLSAHFYLFEPVYDAACTIACVLRNENGFPQAVVGLGIDFNPLQAMYKAFLEATGVLQLAKVTSMNDSLEGPDGAAGGEGAFLDLDHNVSHYATGDASALLERCFGAGRAIPASELAGSAAARRPSVRSLIAQLGDDRIRLFVQDLSWADVRCLGLRCVRLWSPDLLPMCLPDLPPLGHARFSRFGTPSAAHPHPYA